MDAKAWNAVSVERFKAAMGRFAASVHVITSADGGQMNGMTATAVCSVTADPPSALAVVNRANRSHPLIDRSKVFAVNVLAAGQQDVADLFASKAAEPFARVAHRVGDTGCPLIEGAEAHLECVVTNQFDVGTHTIFVGRIVATQAGSGRPLVYHAGRYGELSGEPA